jgi:hypothetical protein
MVITLITSLIGVVWIHKHGLGRLSTEFRTVQDPSVEQPLRSIEDHTKRLRSLPLGRSPGYGRVVFLRRGKPQRRNLVWRMHRLTCVRHNAGPKFLETSPRSYAAGRVNKSTYDQGKSPEQKVGVALARAQDNQSWSHTLRAMPFGWTACLKMQRAPS